MRKKQPAVQATALAHIGADPIGEFIKTMPRTATILGCKGSRSAGKQVIYVAYLKMVKFIMLIAPSPKVAQYRLTSKYYR